MRRVLSWVPIAVLAAIVAGYLARDVLAPPREDLVIEPPPAARVPPLVLAERTLSLAGRVVDPAGEGVPSALVWLRAGDEPHWTYTEPDGSFRLEELEAGPWSAKVVALGFAPLSLEIEERTELVTIPLDRPFGPPPTLPPLVRAPLLGTVTSALPGSLEGCEVVLLPTRPPLELSAPVPRRADVSADGTFSIPDLITGDYRVEVRPGWARGGSWPDLAAAERTFVHASPFETGGPSKLDVDLAAGNVTGKLVDLDFETVEGALLLLADASDPSRVWPTVQSAPDGSFTLVRIPAGRYTLTARAGSATLAQEIEVRADETTTLDVAPLEVRRSH